MRIKYLTIGLIAGALLATAGTSLAAPLIEKVTASLRLDYKVELDGQTVELQNAPLIYNGASYLPVREVGELVGKDVAFENGTIKLTEKEDANLTEEWVGLRQLTSVGVEVTVSPGNILTIQKGDAKVEFLSTDIVPDDTVILSYEGISFEVRSQNGQTYLKTDDLKKFGVID